jgi:hypothetical protein
VNIKKRVNFNISNFKIQTGSVASDVGLSQLGTCGTITHFRKHKQAHLYVSPGNYRTKQLSMEEELSCN